MPLKDFGFLFLFALTGAAIYELVVYLAEPYSIDWATLISEVVIVSLLVSGILFLVKNVVAKKGDR